MVTLKSTAAIYLLHPGLETLHEQSVDWLSDIAFWRDEAAFLYALEIKKTLKQVPIKAKEAMELAENELVRLSGGDIDKLYDEVVKHEHYLSNLLESKKENEEDYREKHEKIAGKVAKLEERFKKLKREIFEVVKQNKGDLLESVLGIKRKK